MTAQILDGKATAAAIKSELTARVAALKARGITPGLGTLLVGDDPGSRWYVNGKHKDCAEVGIASIQRELPATASQEDIEEVVRELNANPQCTGYIVQLPLPKGIDTNRVLELMDPLKDADGLHPMSLGQARPERAGPAALHPVRDRRTAAPPRRRDQRGARRRPRPRHHRRALDRPAADPQVRERHRDALPHRYPRPLGAAAPGGHRRRRGGCPAPGQAGGREAGRGRARRGRQPGRERQDRRRRAPRCRRGGRSWISPNPGGVGPMTRAQLLVNVVEAAERSSSAG